MNRGAGFTPCPHNHEEKRMLTNITSEAKPKKGKKGGKSKGSGSGSGGGSVGGNDGG
jgi:hypothetical protein